MYRLDDFDNACAAYEKAIQMAGEPGEPVFHLNYGGGGLQGCLGAGEGSWPASDVVGWLEMTTGNALLLVR